MLWINGSIDCEINVDAQRDCDEPYAEGNPHGSFTLDKGPDNSFHLKIDINPHPYEDEP